MEKVFEKIKVAIAPDYNGVVADVSIADLEAAGWSDDPGTGKAVLVKDERGNPAYEVFNPLPIAPPIGWQPTPPIEELIAQAVRREFALRDDDEVDDIIDAEDFDIPDELPPLETMYEIVGMEPQAPAVKEPTAEERAAAQVAYEDVLEAHRRVNKRRAREEYERKVKEARELHGEPPDDPNFVRRTEEGA